MRWVFRLFAFSCIVAACYHVAGLFVALNGSPLWRHVLFIAIDVGCAIGFLKRPPWFTWLFGALAVQQCASHGSALLRTWSNGHRISWLDGLVVFFVLFATICLVLAPRGHGPDR